MRVVALADVHNNEQLHVPDGDLLLIAGDLTGSGTLRQMARFSAWLRKLPHRHKVVIAGNHDFCLDRVNERLEAETMLGGDGIVYLRDQSVTIDGLHIYGSPWQPWFHDWAFNLSRGPEIRQKWDQIPEKVDIFLVHGPPQGFGDLTSRGEHAGCEEMLVALERQRPRVTFFGHIHEAPGTWLHQGLTFVNCTVGDIHFPGSRTEEGGPVTMDIEPRSGPF